MECKHCETEIPATDIGLNAEETEWQCPKCWEWNNYLRRPAEVNRRAMSDELTKEFILHEYKAKYGMSDLEIETSAINRFRNDPIFNAQVRTLVAGVMHIVGKHIP